MQGRINCNDKNVGVQNQKNRFLAGTVSFFNRLLDWSD